MGVGSEGRRIEKSACNNPTFSPTARRRMRAQLVRRILRRFEDEAGSKSPENLRVANFQAKASKQSRTGSRCCRLSLSLASGASIATATPSLDTITPNARESHESILREEELCDVSLATFCVFDKESAGAFRPGERLMKVSGCCLFACLAGQSSTGFEGTSAPGNNAYSLRAQRPNTPTHKHARKKR